LARDCYLLQVVTAPALVMQAGAVCLLGGPSSPGRSSRSTIAITQDASGREMARIFRNAVVGLAQQQPLLQAPIGIGAAMASSSERSFSVSVVA